MKCPNCKQTVNRVLMTKPFDYIVISCMHCGFFSAPSIGYFTLEELNETRQMYKLPPLESLPPQTERFIGTKIIVTKGETLC